MSKTVSRDAGSFGSTPTVLRLKSNVESVLDAVVPDVSRFALLDFPDYDNIGDSAIWIGTMAYLDRRGSRASYVSTHDNFSAERLAAAVGTDGPILLQGGGNFGDVWPWFQPFRESVLALYPRRPIVQLPQSIHYDARENIDRTARAIEAHGAFTLLVRDTNSLEFARANFQCDTHLCPDMAFCIGQQRRPEPIDRDLLVHLRQDKEAGTGRDGARLPTGAGVLRADWPKEPANYRRRTKISAVLDALRSGRVGGRASMTEHAYRFRAQDRFDRGAALLGSARRVLTDRLHGHIMSLLLGIPHVVLDNSYGKNSRFITTWNTCESGDARFAADMSQAVEFLARA